MTRLQLLDYDGDRLRVGPWREGEHRAYLAPLPGGLPPRPTSIRRAVEDLLRQGFRWVVTSALAPREQDPFLAAGFRIEERLHLLTHELRDLPTPPGNGAGARPPGGSGEPLQIRRGRRSDRAATIRVDNSAFPPFWRIDRPGLLDALTATPSSRFRIASTYRLVGYAVAGRAGPRGYLQRLAVDPEEQGKGAGTALATDCLWWMRRRGAVSATVNTQESNAAALTLYERLGFRRESQGLAVLGWSAERERT